MSGPRYAPPNDAGEKPYVVEVNDWGRIKQRLVYAVSPSEAKYAAVGRSGPGIYALRARRATPADVHELGAHS